VDLFLQATRLPPQHVEFVRDHRALGNSIERYITPARGNRKCPPRHRAKSQALGSPLAAATPTPKVTSAACKRVVDTVSSQGTVTDSLHPCVLRSNRAQPPTTSATKARACRFVQTRQIRPRLSGSSATLLTVCQIVAIDPWIATFASASARIVLIPLGIPFS
jgi:hypothetical protein